MRSFLSFFKRFRKPRWLIFFAFCLGVYGWISIADHIRFWDLDEFRPIRTAQQLEDEFNRTPPPQRKLKIF